MANANVNKVVYGNTTLIDLTGDTAVANKVLSGYIFHDKSGATVTGSCTYNADTSDGTIDASEVLSGEIAYSNGNRITGTMANNGAVMAAISNVNGSYSVPVGYHDGGGSVSIAPVEKAKIIASNIKDGVQILGVTGTYAGEAQPTQVKTATPYTTQQVVLPDSGYMLSQVTVNAIAYTEVDNSSGGKTVTIGTVAP